MTSRTNTTRTIRLAIATAAALMLMSAAAQARPVGAVGLQVQTPPSPSAYQGTYRPTTNVVTTPPDRTDRIGTTHAVLGHPTVTTKTVAARTTANGFDWAAATVGAGSTLIVVLIAGAGLAARGRRRVPLSA
jgi:hypothetical protein